MRALVIDDSRTVRAIIGKILREEGLEVVEAANGREGLEQLQQSAGVELILVDWNMPEMNGLDFIKAVRADRTYDAVRIMMVTTETEQEQVIRALEAGANEYVMKPFTKEILVAKLSLLGVFGEWLVPKIRVLIVDDAAVFRRVVAEELDADPAIEVVGTAANGKIALARLAQVTPDIVILDVEMPEMDGLATLREIRKTHPRLPVVMFSSLTERGAATTLDALALGATDYFAKPTGAGGLDASRQVIREELIPEIKALCAKPAASVAPVAPATTPPPLAGDRRIDVVAIATSTGGPNALADVFAALPADLPVPVVIVQHMPPMFTRLLAERLSAQSAVRVEEGRAGGQLRPGHAWVAPGDHHMTVVRDAAGMRVQLNQEPPENSCRPAADVLFRSVAQAFGPAALAVVMTGMGQDGLRGCEAIRAAGGQVIAQDEATSVVWGMPGFVARAGLADKVLPLALIGPEVVRRVRAGRGERP